MFPGYVNVVAILTRRQFVQLIALLAKIKHSLILPANTISYQCSYRHYYSLMFESWSWALIGSVSG